MEFDIFLIILQFTTFGYRGKNQKQFLNWYATTPSVGLNCKHFIKKITTEICVFIVMH
jgi:hypothetical protein